MRSIIVHMDILTKILIWYKDDTRNPNLEKNIRILYKKEWRLLDYANYVLPHIFI